MSNRTISIVKERRSAERRVILVPDDIRKFVSHGFNVLVEQGAGENVGFKDSDYISAGAQIASQADAWNKAILVLKYKAPGPDEWKFFRSGLTVASFMHAEGNLTFTETMRSSGLNSYALEFFQTPNGTFPVPITDNEISGKLAIILGAYHLQSTFGGSGILMSRVQGATPPNVVVIGYGNAGGGAATLAAAMGANVTVFGTNRLGLHQFQARMPSNVTCKINEPVAFEKAVLEADLVVGAILISTHDTPEMLSESIVRRMKPGSMIVDVTCGYGRGYMPTFDNFTTHDQPVFTRFGIQHCKIDAMPASVPLTAAPATSANVAPYLFSMALDVLEGIPDSTSRAGRVTYENKVVHPEVLRHIDMETVHG